MPILCGVSPRSLDAAHDAALVAAVALADRTGLGPVQPLDVVAGDPADGLGRAADEHGADLLVTTADDGVDRLAAQAIVPLLVVRDAAPFLAWAAGRAPLRVVLGWDDTSTTAAAVEVVASLRRAGPVDVEVVHVYFPDEAAGRYGLRVESLVEASPELEALLRRDITHQLGELPGDGAVTILPLRGLGRTSDHVLAHAEAVGADLIVVGNHHRGGLRRLSSVATHVLAEASTSVLLVPRRPGLAVELAPPLHTVVVATDGSAFGNRAIGYAYRLVPEGGEVHLVRVVRPDDVTAHGELVDQLLRLHPSSRPRTRTVAHVVRDDDPVHGIATTAERVGADVVCIASHGRTGIARLLGGSVTDRLLHVCRRPVLVVHPVE
jgi:nucleotide-binding universal stress UspA family protein